MIDTSANTLDTLCDGVHQSGGDAFNITENTESPGDDQQAVEMF